MSHGIAIALFLFPGAALAAGPAAGGAGDGLLVGLGVLVAACVALLAVRRAWGLVLAAFAGVATSGWLYVEHAQLKAGAVTTCGVSAAINCTEAARSVYSEMFGIPIALIGVGYFTAMALLAVRHAAGSSPRAPAVLLPLATLAVAYDVFLAWVTFTRLEAVCPLCVTTWALNLLLLVGSAIVVMGMDTTPATAVREGLERDGMNMLFVALGAGLLVGMAAGGGAGAATSGAGSSAAKGDISTTYERPAGRIELRGNEPSKGAPAAKYTLVEWADYECPHCALMFKDLADLIAANPDVKLIYKHYPISEICNHFVEGERHRDACNAAAAAECAQQQGRFWELSGEMFKNQEYLGKDDIRFMVKQLGVDTAAFEACAENPATAAAVRTDVEQGGLAGINGTPSVFLKGPFGDAWVRINGGGKEISAILAADRAGTPLPTPRAPSEQ